MSGHGNHVRGATYGLYPDRVYALNLARSLTTDAGHRTQVVQFNSRLWEINWATPAAEPKETP